jgi:hypothetical protein
MKNIVVLLILLILQPRYFIASNKNIGASSISLDTNNSFIRYFIRDKKWALTCDSKVSGDGFTSVITSWTTFWRINEYIMQNKIECYNNYSGTPVWFHLAESPEWTSLMPYASYVSMSQNGEYTVWSNFDKFYLFNGQNGNEIWNYNVFNLADSTVDSTYRAELVEITRNGEIIIATIRGTIPAYTPVYILAFNRNSPVPIWYHCFKTEWLNRSFIGINISANDSLVIANQYMNFYVMKTYTGEIIYSGIVNPHNPNNYGVGCRQGISGDGSIIAVGNNYGYLRVYKWYGNTYNYLWEDQEPPGASWNPVYAIDVSSDGTKIAAGAFITVNPGYSYTGRIRYYETERGKVPLWIHTDSGRVNYLSFSNNGKILCAATDGSMFTRHENNLLIFNTNYNTNVPVFAVCDSGSFWKCSVSDDGTTVIGTGKAMHSWELGRGKIFYNIFIDTSAMPMGISSTQNKIPEEFTLYQNFPNPFNPVTVINYELPAVSYVTLKIYDMLGKEVTALVNEKQSAGSYSVKWDGSNYPSGVYFYKLTAEDYTNTKKMILIK